MTEKYQSEYMPVWKRISYYPPPKGTKILLRLKHGTAIIGQYYDESGATHWAGLPRLSKEDKEEELRTCG
jgi:hypothetical protein